MIDFSKSMKLGRDVTNALLVKMGVEPTNVKHGSVVTTLVDHGVIEMTMTVFVDADWLRAAIVEANQSDNT